jgi:hypothetical protein
VRESSRFRVKEMCQDENSEEFPLTQPCVDEIADWNTSLHGLASCSQNGRGDRPRKYFPQPIEEF